MFNLNNKTFRLRQNSSEGKVTSEALFYYQQEGDLVTARYHGGTIREGHIIARHKGAHLEMYYHCLTTQGVLKAGHAIASLSEVEGKIKMSLNWQWLQESGATGTSEYEEV